MATSGGTVLADGSVVSTIGNVAPMPGGIVHERSGHYLINFMQPQIAFVVTQVSGWDGNTRDNALVISATGSQFIVKTGDQDGNASDRGFSFIAIDNT